MIYYIDLIFQFKKTPKIRSLTVLLINKIINFIKMLYPPKFIQVNNILILKFTVQLHYKTELEGN